MLEHRIVNTLFVVSTLRRTGPTNQLYNLIKHLDRSRFEPHLITLSPEPAQGSAWPDFEAIGVRLYTLGHSRTKGMFFSKKRFRSLVDQIAPDVVHSQGIRADTLNAAVLGDYPSLCTSRNYPVADYPSKFGKLRGNLMARQHFAAFNKLNVVSCSQTIKAQLGKHGIQARVVCNGVDTEAFAPVSVEQKVALRQKLGLPQDSVLLFSVGSLIPRKDMQTLIAAFERVSLKNTILVILGDGPLMVALRRQAGVSVMMPGNVDNVAEYLGAADLFVSSSLSEGLPNTVLEAMAFGLPCLLSDIPSHRELFEDHGGIFFECLGVDALADCLRQIKAMQLAELGSRSRQIVEARFSALKMSQGYQQIYTMSAEKDKG